MPTNFPVPRPDSVRELLGTIVGDEVRVAVARDVDNPDDAPLIVADYVSDNGAVAVLCIADHKLANSLGGALTGIAPNAVAEAIQGWKLDDGCIDNFREIVNMLTTLFNCDDTPHLRLRELYRQPGPLPEDAASLRKDPLGTRHLVVTIDKYSSGNLSLLVG